MSDPLQYPKLRWPLNVRMDEADGQKFLLINCPLGISNKPLLLKPAFASLVAQFEGHLSLDDIAGKFSAYGVARELVLELATLLDQHLFLDTPRFHEAEAAHRDEFRRAPDRPAALAGLAYPSDRRELEKQIDAYLAKASSGIILPANSGANNDAGSPPHSLIGLIAPHIDYRRGGDCYGITYSRLRSHRADLYILIGTSHQYSRHLFHLTAKNFASPFGSLQADTQFCRKLAERYGTERSFADEVLHRREHSLELQLPFLQRVGRPPSICPILVGGFHRYVSAGKLPNDFDEYESFAGALAEGIREERSRGRKVTVIAGVDMAHVGQHFGDSEPLSADFMERVRARDQLYLRALCARDKSALFSHIAEDQDQRRMCGFPTLYTVLDVLERAQISYQTTLFDYRQAVDQPTQCAVTFAGLGLYESSPLAITNSR